MRRHLLSVLCVTKGESHARPFLEQLASLAELCGAELVLAGDGRAGCAAADAVVAAHRRERGGRLDAKVFEVNSLGFVESVLDRALASCSGEYVLRMDDDERCSPAMASWLESEEYRGCDLWKFPTANLWRDERSIAINEPLWPDYHTRLTVRAKAGGRHVPHATSPYGWGELAPVIHEHHKFLVKNVQRRRAQARHYSRMGALLVAFTLPEATYRTLTLAPLGDGTLRDWRADELEHVSLARAEVPA